MLKSISCGADTLRTELVAPWKEIITVISLILGYPIFVSICVLINELKSNEYLIDDITFYPSYRGVLFAMTYECLFLAVMFFFLRWRGWKKDDIHVRMDGKSSFLGIIILFASKLNYAIFSLFLFICYFCFREYLASVNIFGYQGSENKGLYPNDFNWIILILGNIVTAIFEEIVYTGYAFNQFIAKCGPLLALSLITLLRTLSHAYLGMFYMLAMGGVFLTFSIFYLYTRNLWPIILAHILFNTFPMDILGFILSGLPHAGK